MPLGSDLTQAIVKISRKIEYRSSAPQALRNDMKKISRKLYSLEMTNKEALNYLLSTFVYFVLKNAKDIVLCVLFILKYIF
jgi:hypothetical protein